MADLKDENDKAQTPGTMHRLTVASDGAYQSIISTVSLLGWGVDAFNYITLKSGGDNPVGGHKWINEKLTDLYTGYNGLIGHTVPTAVDTTDKVVHFGGGLVGGMIGGGMLNSAAKAVQGYTVLAPTAAEALIAQRGATITTTTTGKVATQADPTASTTTAAPTELSLVPKTVKPAEATSSATPLPPTSSARGAKWGTNPDGTPKLSPEAQKWADQSHGTTPPPSAPQAAADPLAGAETVPGQIKHGFDARIQNRAAQTPPATPAAAAPEGAVTGANATGATAQAGTKAVTDAVTPGKPLSYLHARRIAKLPNDGEKGGRSLVEKLTSLTASEKGAGPKFIDRVIAEARVRKLSGGEYNDIMKSDLPAPIKAEIKQFYDVEGKLLPYRAWEWGAARVNYAYAETMGVLRNPLNTVIGKSIDVGIGAVKKPLSHLGTMFNPLHPINAAKAWGQTALMGAAGLGLYEFGPSPSTLWNGATSLVTNKDHKKESAAIMAQNTPTTPTNPASTQAGPVVAPRNPNTPVDPNTSDDGLTDEQRASLGITQIGQAVGIDTEALQNGGAGNMVKDGIKGFGNFVKTNPVAAAAGAYAAYDTEGGWIKKSAMGVLWAGIANFVMNLFGINSKQVMGWAKSIIGAVIGPVFGGANSDLNLSHGPKPGLGYNPGQITPPAPGYNGRSARNNAPAYYNPQGYPVQGDPMQGSPELRNAAPPVLVERAVVAPREMPVPSAETPSMPEGAVAIPVAPQSPVQGRALGSVAQKTVDGNTSPGVLQDEANRAASQAPAAAVVAEATNTAKEFVGTYGHGENGDGATRQLREVVAQAETAAALDNMRKGPKNNLQVLSLTI